MKILIEISDQKYKWIVDNPQTYTDDLCEAIRNGTPLPKGHGRLIDADALTEKAPEIQEHLDVLAPTIIEADKENADEKN